MCPSLPACSYARQSPPRAALLRALDDWSARLRSQRGSRAVTSVDVLVPSVRVHPHLLGGIIDTCLADMQVAGSPCTCIHVHPSLHNS